MRHLSPCFCTGCNVTNIRHVGSLLGEGPLATGPFLRIDQRGKLLATECCSAVGLIWFLHYHWSQDHSLLFWGHAVYAYLAYCSHVSRQDWCNCTVNPVNPRMLSDRCCQRSNLNSVSDLPQSRSSTSPLRLNKSRDSCQILWSSLTHLTICGKKVDTIDRDLNTYLYNETVDQSAPNSSQLFKRGVAQFCLLGVSKRQTPCLHKSIYRLSALQQAGLASKLYVWRLQHSLFTWPAKWLNMSIHSHVRQYVMIPCQYLYLYIYIYIHTLHV